ncbi:MAG: hypothetical protein DRP74_07815, partial [Candidatus Omnitrophota bacterium]
MSSPSSSISLIKKVYQNTGIFLKTQPKLVVPFAIFAAVEALVLFFFFLAPREPFISFMGPIISRLWGDAYLHYPTNFLLLPRLGSISRMFLAVVLSSLLTGMAVFLVAKVRNKEQVNLKEAFIQAVKRYLSLLIIVGLLVVFFYVSVKAFSFLVVKYFTATGQTRLLWMKPAIWFGPISLAVNFFIALIIQSLFVYAIPFLMIGKEKLVKAIIRSLVLFKRLFLPTLVLVGIPLLLYVPITILEQNSAFLIQRVFPEFILIVLLLGIAISSLVVDLLVTISTATLY